MKKKAGVNTQAPHLFQNPENQENFRLFYSFLSRPGKGLCLCQAMPPEQLKILEFFKTDPMGNRINFIDMINPLSGPMELQLSVLGVIDKFGSSKDIFFIYHLEECIFQSKIDAREFFNGLNLIRDFFGRFRAVFVFFMTESLAKTMIRHAFDFYDWMKLTFEFHPEKEQALPQITDMEIPWKKKYSDIGKKIKYLEKSLELMKNEKEKLLRVLELGSLYTQVYKYDKALEHFHSAEETASRLGDKEGLSRALSGEGSIFRIRGDYEAALEKYEQSLKIREQLGDRGGVAKSLHNIGIIFQNRGDYGTALKKYESARQVSEEMGDKVNVAKSLHQVGMIYHMTGDYTEALNKYEQVRQVFEEIGDRKSVAATLHQVGMIYQMKGDYAAALEKYEQSRQVFEEMGDKANLAKSLHQVGMIFQMKGDFAVALEKYEQSLKLKEELGDRAGMATTLHQVGRIYQEKRDYGTALERYELALQKFEEIGDKANIASSLHNIGILYQSIGDYARALEKYEQSLKKKEEIGDKFGIALVYGQLGLLFQVTGKFAKAFEYFMTALAIFTELESPDAEKAIRNLNKLRTEWGEDIFDSEFEKKTGGKWISGD